MQLDQRFGDRKPQSRSVMGLGELALHLLERPSEPRQRVLRDADAGVADIDRRRSRRRGGRVPSPDRQHW